MTEPGRIADHAQRAGCATVADYAGKLEDLLEAIVYGDRHRLDDDGDELHGALRDAGDLVDSWDIRP